MEKTYKGVSGYIYFAENVTDSGIEIRIPNAASSSTPVTVSDSEFISDAYEAILEAEEKGLISIMRYCEIPEKMHDWIERTILKEYEEATNHTEYRHFLKGNFEDILSV